MKVGYFYHFLTDKLFLQYKDVKLETTGVELLRSDCKAFPVHRFVFLLFLYFLRLFNIKYFKVSHYIFSFS